jgi:hypothetical protein
VLEERERVYLRALQDERVLSPEESERENDGLGI